jgi:hypothetical protein
MYFIVIFMYSYCYLCNILWYSVSLCCSVYRLCVNVLSTTATGCQPNCGKQIYHTKMVEDEKDKGFSTHKSKIVHVQQFSGNA